MIIQADMNEHEKACGVRLFGGGRNTNTYRQNIADNGGWVLRENKLPPPQPSTIWVWRPWCVLPSTFGGATHEEARERQLHKEHKCSGRNFVKEADWRHKQHVRLNSVEPMDIDG